MIIYADLYFIVNFVFDFVLICITGHIMKYKKRILYISAACALSAVVSFMTVIFKLRTVSVIIMLFLPAIMLYISYGKRNWLCFAQSYCLFFGSSFVSGGIFKAMSDKNFFPSPLLAFIILCGIFFFCFIYFDIFSFNKEIKKIDIVIKGKKYEKKLHLLCDSGCVAKEPISGLPVILISPKIFDEIYKSDNSQKFAVENRLRLIPIKTASGSCVIESCIPDSITYTKKKKTICCKAVVGRSNSLCFVGTDGIFPTSLLV